jgi:chemotaxis protein MotB
MSEEQTNQEEKKKEKKSESGGAPAWMVTYSDLVTLLLTFFVLLLSMASMDPVRFTQASSSLKDAFGMHQNPAQVDFTIPILPSPPKTLVEPINEQMTIEIYRKIKTQIDSEDLSEDIEMIQQEDDTIVLRVKDTVLFQPGETQISPKSFPMLRYIADIIRPLPLKLRIEGHSDSVTDAKSELGKWDISMARSVSVMRFLRKSDLLPLERMGAAGYGDTKPIATNASNDGRALNRRVDFVLQANNTGKVIRSFNTENDIPF